MLKALAHCCKIHLCRRTMEWLMGAIQEEIHIIHILSLAICEMQSDVAAFYIRLGNAANKCMPSTINARRKHQDGVNLYLPLCTRYCQQVQKCCNDSSQFRGFINNKQNHCAMKKLASHFGGNAEEIK